MNNVKKYIADARANGNARYANSDGNFEVNPMGNRNTFSNFGGGYSNAAGTGAQSGAPTSQPYVVNVTSTSAAAVSDFEILGSNTYLYGGTGTWTNGSLVIGSITISSGTPGVTYQQMLAQFQTQPFLCGLTYYQSSTANQVLQVVQIITKDANGNEQKMPIVPTIDPYQFQGTILALRNAFTVNGFTSVKVASVLANATITFQFYPSDKIDTTSGLAGNPVNKAYSDPGIVKAQPVVVQ